MPISKENKNRYPSNWKEISNWVRFIRAKNHCEFCGVENYSTGYWLQNKFYTEEYCFEHLEKTGEDLLEDIPYDKKPVRIILTVAHLDHQPENNDYENLKALCQRCHNNHDKEHRKKYEFQLNLF